MKVGRQPTTGNLATANNLQRDSGGSGTYQLLGTEGLTLPTPPPGGSGGEARSLQKLNPTADIVLVATEEAKFTQKKEKGRHGIRTVEQLLCILSFVSLCSHY